MDGARVPAPAALSVYAEAQLSGWVPSPPELRTRDNPENAHPAENADPDALVARFYSCQEC